MEFFDSFPAFAEPTRIGADRNRLNQRFEVLIGSNLRYIAGKRVLDLASYDGRWAFAALKSGARHVVGIEGSARFVEMAHTAFAEYEIPSDLYRFIVGDVHDTIATITPGTIDTVFCFGFFYHTAHHLALLSSIRRLRPQYLILDTEVVGAKSMDAIIQLREQNPAVWGGGVRDLTPQGKVVAGTPSRAAIEMMLASLGFCWEYRLWEKTNTRWERLEDYRTGKRVTLVAERLAEDE
jgi:SAM-dependent methyltransferase